MNPVIIGDCLDVMPTLDAESDGSEEVVALFPETISGALEDGHKQGAGMFGRVGGAFVVGNYGGDTGSAARFFYCSKADREDRNEGCETMEKKPLNWSSGDQSPGTFQAENTDRSAHNAHPTVKPLDLMRYLCRLVTPRGGLILDPFAGSGSTGKAAVLEGFRFIGIELEADSAAIANARISDAASPGPLFRQEAQA